MIKVSIFSGSGYSVHFALFLQTIHIDVLRIPIDNSLDRLNFDQAL